MTGLPANWRELAQQFEQGNRGGGSIQKCTVIEFIELLEAHKGATAKIARILNTSPRVVCTRRANIESALGWRLPRGRWETWRQSEGQNRIIDLELENATIMVGSDLHKWPDLTGTAERAFIAINQMLKPTYVFLNGDGADLPGVGRHDRIGWEVRPTVAEELEALQEFSFALIEQNKNGKYIRTRGNHDGRFDTYLSGNAPAMEGVKGMCLQDHLQMWTECVAINVNRDQPSHLTVKHRGRHCGIHSTYNNTLKTGVNMIYGHEHNQRVTPFTDARGTRWGCDAGMLAPVHGPQFAYAEADVSNWRSGFLFCTYIDGELMEPEKITVIDEDEGIIYFRGQRWQV